MPAKQGSKKIPSSIGCPNITHQVLGHYKSIDQKQIYPVMNYKKSVTHLGN